MGDATSGQPAGAGPRRQGGTLGSSVLTPPTGMHAVPGIEPFVPPQRTEARHAAVTPPAPPVRHTAIAPCRCGHGRDAHEHFRPGSDCGACGERTCAQYRPDHTRWRQMLRWMGLAP